MAAGRNLEGAAGSIAPSCATPGMEAQGAAARDAAAQGAAACATQPTRAPEYAHATCNLTTAPGAPGIATATPAIAAGMRTTAKSYIVPYVYAHTYRTYVRSVCYIAYVALFIAPRRARASTILPHRNAFFACLYCCLRFSPISLRAPTRAHGYIYVRIILRRSRLHNALV